MNFKWSPAFRNGALEGRNLIRIFYENLGFRVEVLGFAGFRTDRCNYVFALKEVLNSSCPCIPGTQVLREERLCWKLPGVCQAASRIPFTPVQQSLAKDDQHEGTLILWSEENDS